MKANPKSQITKGISLIISIKKNQGYLYNKDLNQ